MSNRIAFKNAGSIVDLKAGPRAKLVPRSLEGIRIRSSIESQTAYLRLAENRRAGDMLGWELIGVEQFVFHLDAIKKSRRILKLRTSQGRLLEVKLRRIVWIKIFPGAKPF
ncbi:unnamed protein product [Ilex paraguariensis]|uniref:Uncharacterized protein n=1 Tax=Ilex paraguariensis TaxID=185542 RepID=A0ABC8SYX9_9AQUA